MRNRYHASATQFKRNFILASLLFLAVSTAFSLMERERRKISRLEKELASVDTGLARLHVAVENHRLAIASLKSLFREKGGAMTQEREIYSKVDQMSRIYKPDELVVGAVEKKGDEAFLKFTMTFRNGDFSSILNCIGRLERNVFPFTPVDSVSISQTEESGRGFSPVVISGRVISPVRGEP